jgi:hypothetical protein
MARLYLASDVNRVSGFGYVLSGIRVASENGRLGNFVVQRDGRWGRRGSRLLPVWRRSQEAVLVMCRLNSEEDGDKWKQLESAGKMRGLY